MRTADTIPSDQWTRRPNEEAWSAAEIVAHLMMVERAVVGVGGADRMIRKAPQPAGFLDRLHLPLWMVEARLVRRKSPIALDPALLSNQEEMLGELRAVRERSLAFPEETRTRDLSFYRWPHVFAGPLNVYEWSEMIAAHQLRHSKQMKEICVRLPKVVGISQNR